MPEPTTDPIAIIREKVARWAPQQVSDVMFSLADISDLLAAYHRARDSADTYRTSARLHTRREQTAVQQRDAAVAELAETHAALAEISQVWARRDLAAWEAKDRALAAAEARAAAAEAAVQRVREHAEREYVISLNAVLASPNENADVHRWRGHAEALRQVAEQCCRESRVTIPAYRSDEWRQANGVYSQDLIDRWNAGRDVAAWETGHATPPHQAEPHLPADPATTVAGIVQAAPHDQPVTVTGYIHDVAACSNHAGAPSLELVLADRDAEIEDADPDTVKVIVPASVFAAMDLAVKPRAGTLVEVTGRAVREVLVIASSVREVNEDGAR